MKQNVWMLGWLVLFLIVLPGCVSKQTPTPPPTLTAEPGLTQTATPLVLTPTPVPTYTSTLLPTATPTILPGSVEILTVENASQIQLLDVYGRGAPVSVSLAMNGKMTIVQTPYGIYLYDENLALVNFIASNTAGITWGYEDVFEISEDGALLAVVLPDYSVQVWDLAIGQPIQILSHTTELPKYPSEWFNEDDFRRPHAIAFLPENGLLAVGFGDGNVEIMNLDTGKTLQLTGTDVSPMPDMLAFSVDGSYLASGTTSASQDRPVGVAVWSVPEQKLLLRIPSAGSLPPHPFSPDNSILLTYAPVEAGVVYLWDAASGQRIARYGTNLPAPPSFSADGQQLLINNGEQVRRVSDGKLLGATPTPAPYLPDMPALRQLEHFNGLQGGRWQDAETITAWGADGNLYLWHPRAVDVTEINQQLDPGVQIAGAFDGNSLAYCAGRDLTVLDTVSATPRPLTVCLDGSVLAISDEYVARGARSMLDLINLSDGEVSASMQGHNHPIYSMAFSPDNAYLVSGTEELSSLGVVDAFMWSVTPPSRVARQEGIPYIVHALAIAPDNLLFAIAYGNGFVRIVRVADEYTLAILPDPAKLLAFSPDGKLFATGSDQGTINIYKVSDWTLLSTLPGHFGKIVDLSFSPDGYNFLTTSTDGTIRLWGIP